jgi:hypothetical protein
MNVDSPSASVFTRHDSDFSADSGYASSPHDSLPSSTNSIKLQYLEALYSTKTSLAYFAKSALSRTRSEYLGLENSLISILQNIILKADDFNTKYDELLPTAVKENLSPSLPVSDEERKHLIRKFNRGGGDEDEIAESTLLRRINDLKIREY